MKLCSNSVIALGSFAALDEGDIALLKTYVSTLHLQYLHLHLIYTLIQNFYTYIICLNPDLTGIHLSLV